MLLVLSRTVLLELNGFCVEFPGFVCMKTKNIVTGHLLGPMCLPFMIMCGIQLCAILVKLF